MGRLENGFRKVAGRSQNGFSATFFQNVLQTFRKLSKKARINVLPKLFHNQIQTLSQRFHNVFCNVVPNRCHNVFTTFFCNVVPKRFANIEKTFQKSSHKRFTKTFSQPNKNVVTTFSQRFFVSWVQSIMKSIVSFDTRMSDLPPHPPWMTPVV